jgi:hypothetical protein
MSELDFSRMFSGASPVLANLAPIPVVNPAAGGTFQFQPLSAVQAVSAHPELIGEGLAQGIGTLAQGYISKQQQEKKDAKDALEKARQATLDAQKQQFEEKKYALESQKTALAERRQDQLEKQWQDRLEGVGALNKSASVISLGNQTEASKSPTPPNDQETPSAVRNVGPLEQSLRAPETDQRFKRDFTSPLNSPTQPMDVGTPAGEIRPEGKPLSDLSSPVSTQAMALLGPSPAVPNLFNTQVLGAGNPPAGTNPAAGIQPLSALSGQLQLAGQVGNQSIPEQLAIEKQLYNLPEPTAAAPKKDPVLEQYLNNYGPYDEQTAQRLAKYAKEQGYGDVPIKPHEKGGKILDWEYAENKKVAEEARKAAQGAKEASSDRLFTARIVKQLSNDVNDFKKDKLVNNYENSRGFFAMLPRISAAYEAAMEDPSSSGIPDAEIAQLLAQAASGGVATRGAIEDFLHQRGIKDNLELWKNKILYGGKSGLSTRAKNQAVDLIVQEAKGQAQQANQSVASWRSTYGDRTDEDTLNQHIHPFIEPKTRKETTKELGALANKVVDLHRLYDAAVAAKDSRADALYKEWFDASRKVAEIQAMLANASGPIVNMQDILTKPQGFLSPVPINKIKPESLKMLKASVADKPELDSSDNMAYDSALNNK